MDILIGLEQAARVAGAIALKMQASASIAVDKGAGDFATTADVAAGNALRECLQSIFPGVPILSEEQEEREQELVLRSDTFLVFDDLDATMVYFNQGDDWGHNVGYVQGGKLTHVVMFLPKRKVLITAALGKGCKINGEQVVLSQKNLAQGIVGIIFNRGIPQSFHDDVSTPLCYIAGGTRCLNSNIGGITEVVEGKCVGFINLVGHIWDFVGVLAVQEAGGIAMSPNGDELSWNKIPMSVLVAANGGVADEMSATTTKWQLYGRAYMEIVVEQGCSLERLLARVAVFFFVCWVAFL